MENDKPKKTIDLKSEVLAISSHTFTRRRFETVEIGNNEYKSEEINFKNCDFVGDFFLSDIEITNGLHFENCSFLGKVKLLNISANENPNTYSYSGSLSFKNCKFDQRFRIVNLKARRGLFFHDCKFSEGLFLHSLSINEGFSIHTCDIVEVLEIMKCELAGSISIGSTTSHGECLITETICKNLSFSEKNLFEDVLNIHGCKMNDYLSFRDGEFKGTVALMLNITDCLGIENSQFFKPFNIDYQSHNDAPLKGIRSFRINGVKFYDGLNVKGRVHPGKTHPEVLECKIVCTAALTGNMSFSDLAIHHLSVSGYNSSAKISLNDIAVREFSITDFINEGMLVLSKVYALKDRVGDDQKPLLTSFQVYNTNFGKGQFFQVNFKSFDHVYFSNVILSEISTFNVEWFTREQLEGNQDYITEYNLAKKGNHQDDSKMSRAVLLAWLRSTREIYRQLKFVAIKQGDMPLSHRFQAQEMNLYQKITRYETPRTWNEYLILFTNQSNNFGQSWTKPLKLLIFFSLLAYLPIGLQVVDQFDISRFAKNWDEVGLTLRVLFYDQIKLWLVLLNPTHRINELTEKHVGFWFYFWDGISRIIVSYFLFQAISAFRKFSK